MTEFIRFVVEVDETALVTVTCAETGAKGEPRQMRRLPDPTGGYFPLPPPGEACGMATSASPMCGGLCLTQNADRLHDERARVEQRQVDGVLGAQRLGAYLFHALIGLKTWDWMLRLAAERGARCLELALSWPRGDGSLSRFNWEMMHSGQGFLAAGRPGLAVVITRLVPRTEGAAWRPVSADAPPRVLFVVGSALNDPSIRPAAEFLGLLHELRDSGRRADTRLLERATSERLAAAVREFVPDVVHFACHGDWDRDSARGFLELTPGPPPDNGRRFGDQLVQSLTSGDGRLPSVVVLSACRSGAVGPPETAAAPHATYQLAPLAAELVEQGVPIVLGMAGRVSDTACRLFTRRFNAMLVSGGSLLAATAEARRATVSEGESSTDSVDWAFPALFLAGAVPSDHRPVTSTATPARDAAAERILAYKLSLTPVFCGRTAFIDAYRTFSRSNGNQVLVIFGEPDVPPDSTAARRKSEGFWRIGKTRLLQELVAQAVVDGNVPVLVSAARLDWAPPATLSAFADRLRQAVSQARKAFRLGPAAVDQLRLLGVATRLRSQARPGEPYLGGPELRELDPGIRIEFEDYGTVTAEALRLALQHDLVRLAKDGRAGDPKVGRAMVLIDGFEQYPAPVVEAVFDDMLDGFGFGDADEPVPVVLALAKNPDSGPLVHDLMERAATSSWLESLVLRPFDVDAAEDVFAYNQIILNPFGGGGADGDLRYVLDDRVPLDRLEQARDLLRHEFDGVPGRFADQPKLRAITKMLMKWGLVRALTSVEAEERALAAARIPLDAP